MTNSKRVYLWAVLCMAAALLVTYLARPISRFLRNSKLNADSLSISSQSENMCGPKALFVALNRLGIPITLQEIEKDFSSSGQGVTFAQLRRAADKLGCHSSVRTLTWETLSSAGASAVLWVNGDHFVAADPREKRSSQDRWRGSIRIYDTDTPAQWWSRAQLEHIWNGETLLIQKADTTKNASHDGPRIEWKDCLRDFGYVDAGRLLKGVFEFENAGNADLAARVAVVGCGCAKATLSPRVLKPRQVGQLHITVDTKAKRGYLLTHVIVESDDPARKHSPVFMRGGVHHSNLISADVLYFGHITKGSKCRKSFCVYDAGETKLRISDVRAEFEQETNGTTTGPLEASVEVKPFVRPTGIPQVQQRLPFKYGDYVILMTLHPRASCATRPFAGRVVVSTNQPAGNAQQSVAFRGEVVTDISASPPSILLSADKDGRATTRITITRQAPNPLRLLDVKMDGESAPILAFFEEQLSGSALTVNLSFALPDGTARAAYHGSLLLDFSDGDRLTVPVILLHANPKEAQGVGNVSGADSRLEKQ